MKIKHTKVTASIDTGLHYWYKFKHGLGPGTMPSDCHILKVVEDGWKDYVLLDRMLTTQELNEYEIKEEEPSDELLAQNGITDKYMQGEVTGAAGVSLHAGDREIPKPYDTYFRMAEKGELEDEYEDSIAEEASGYDFIHLGWAIARDPYYDFFANNGMEIMEVVSEGDPGDAMLVYTIGDRVYPLTESDLPDEDEVDVLEATDVEASEDINIFKFYDWYNTLPLKQRHEVDDWCDEEGYPLYDNCSQAELATIHDHFESEFAQRNESNFHVAAFGNDYDELQSSYDFDNPKAAITKWVELQKAWPLNVMITGFQKAEEQLREYVSSHQDWYKALSEKNHCPYDPEYIIAECEKPVRPRTGKYANVYPDQCHPFGLG